MLKQEDQKKEIQELIDMGKKLHVHLSKTDFKANQITEETVSNFTFFRDNYEQWYSKAYVVVKIILLYQ